MKRSRFSEEQIIGGERPSTARWSYRIHGANRAQADAAVEQGDVDFGWGKIDEVVLMLDNEHRGAFIGHQRPPLAGRQGTSAPVPPLPRQ